MQQFDAIASSEQEEYDALVEPTYQDKEDLKHAHKPTGAVRITRFAKAVFGLGFCAENMFDVAGDTLLTKFYVDHLNMNLYWLSMATFVAGICGALSQLWLGYVGDRFQSKYGRRRPFIVVLSIICGCAIVALMFPPMAVRKPGVIEPWFFILYTILEVARETTELSYDSLGTEVTQDEEERSELYAYQAAMGVVGILFVAGGNSIFSALFGEMESFKILGLGIGLFSTAGNLFLAWYIKENEAFREQGAMPLVPGFRSCMANKPWILLAWCNGLLRMINEFSGLYPFVFSFCLKVNQDTWLAVGVCLMAFTRLLGVPFILKLTQRFGKIPAFVVSLLICITSGILTFFSLFIDHPIPFCLTLGVLGFGFAGTGMAVNIMLSDSIDYDELHTGKRRESTYHSITGVPQETLSVVARSAPLMILYMLGYKEDDKDNQNESVVFALKVMAGGIPVVVSLISLLLLQWYHIDEGVHHQIMAAIQRRARGEVHGVVDPLTSEPVIPLEKTPDMAVELTLKENGVGGGGERVGLISGGDPPAQALGTYMLYFADKEIRLIKNGGRWFFLLKYILSTVFWLLNTGLSSYAAGTLLVDNSGSEKAANYAYIALLIATFCALGFFYEVLRFSGVKWLVTMSPTVVAKVIRRRKRILRTTHKLLSEKANTPLGDVMKKSLHEIVNDEQKQLTRMSSGTGDRLIGPGTFKRESSYTRTLLSDDSMDDKEAAAPFVSPTVGSGITPSQTRPGVFMPTAADSTAMYEKEKLSLLGWSISKGSKIEMFAKERQVKEAQRVKDKASRDTGASGSGRGVTQPKRKKKKPRCTTVWHSANSVRDAEDSDGDSDEEIEVDREGMDPSVLAELERFHITDANEDARLLALSNTSKSRGAFMDELPTLMPSKEEVVPIRASFIPALITGKNLSRTQAAAREIMRVMAVKFIMLHGPILGACVLLNITSLIMS